MKRFALKRITALVLALIMTLSLLPMTVWATETGTESEQQEQQNDVSAQTDYKPLYYFDGSNYNESFTAYNINENFGFRLTTAESETAIVCTSQGYDDSNLSTEGNIGTFTCRENDCEWIPAGATDAEGFLRVDKDNTVYRMKVTINNGRSVFTYQGVDFYTAYDGTTLSYGDWVYSDLSLTINGGGGVSAVVPYAEGATSVDLYFKPAEGYTLELPEHREEYSSLSAVDANNVYTLTMSDLERNTSVFVYEETTFVGEIDILFSARGNSGGDSGDESGGSTDTETEQQLYVNMGNDTTPDYQTTFRGDINAAEPYGLWLFIDDGSSATEVNGGYKPGWKGNIGSFTFVEGAGFKWDTTGATDSEGYLEVRHDDAPGIVYRMKVTLNTGRSAFTHQNVDIYTTYDNEMLGYREKDHGDIRTVINGGGGVSVIANCANDLTSASVYLKPAAGLTLQLSDWHASFSDLSVADGNGVYELTLSDLDKNTVVLVFDDGEKVGEIDIMFSRQGDGGSSGNGNKMYVAVGEGENITFEDTFRGDIDAETPYGLWLFVEGETGPVEVTGAYAPSWKGNIGSFTFVEGSGFQWDTTGATDSEGYLEVVKDNVIYRMKVTLDNGRPVYTYQGVDFYTAYDGTTLGYEGWGYEDIEAIVNGGGGISVLIPFATGPDSFTIYLKPADGLTLTLPEHREAYTKLSGPDTNGVYALLMQKLDRNTSVVVSDGSNNVDLDILFSAREKTKTYYTKDGYSKITLTLFSGVEDVIRFPDTLTEDNELILTIKNPNAEGADSLAIREGWRKLLNRGNDKFWIPYEADAINAPEGATANPLVSTLDSDRELSYVYADLIAEIERIEADGGEAFHGYDEYEPDRVNSAVYGWNSEPKKGEITILPKTGNMSRAWVWRYVDGVSEPVDQMDGFIIRVVSEGGNLIKVPETETYPAVPESRIQLVEHTNLDQVLFFGTDEYDTTNKEFKDGATDDGVLTYYYKGTVPTTGFVSEHIDNTVVEAASLDGYTADAWGWIYYYPLKVTAPTGYTAKSVKFGQDTRTYGNGETTVELQFFWDGVGTEQTYVLTWSKGSGSMYTETVEQITLATPSVTGAEPWMAHAVDGDTVYRATPVAADRVIYTSLDGVNGVTDDTTSRVKGVTTHKYDETTGKLFTTFNDDELVDVPAVLNATFAIKAPEGAVSYQAVMGGDGRDDPAYNNFTASHAELVWGSVVQGQKFTPVNGMTGAVTIDALNQQVVGEIEYYYSAYQGTRFVLLKWEIVKEVDGVSTTEYLYEYIQIDASSYICEWETPAVPTTDPSFSDEETTVTPVDKPTVAFDGNIKLVSRLHPQNKSGHFFFELEVVDANTGNAYIVQEGDKFIIVLPYEFMGVDETGGPWTYETAKKMKSAKIQHFDDDFTLKENEGNLSGTFTERGIEFTVGSFSPFLLKLGEHEHEYTYTASGAVITESCTCGHSETATIAAPMGTLIYDGIAKVATVSYSDSWAAEKDLTVSYGNQGNVNAGEVTAVITKGSVSATVTYTIDKDDPDYIVPANLIATYGQTLADVTLPDGWSWDDANQSVGDVGTKSFDATFTPTNTTNYNTVEAEVSVTVNAKQLTNPTLTLDVSSFTYDDSAKTPVVTVKDGTTELTKDIDYTVSYSDNTNAGTGKVTVTFTGNYSGSAEKSFTISKANQEGFAIADTPIVDIAYGDSFTLSTTGGNGNGAVSWAVTTGSQYAEIDETGKVTVKGVGTVTITVTKAESANYNAAADAYTFTSVKATPVLGTVAVSGTVKDTTAPEDVVLTQTGTVAGAFEITDDAMLANKSTYNWTFTPTDTVNYTTITGTVEIEVADTQAPSATITVDTKEWKEKLNNITFGIFFDNTQTVTITYADNDNGSGIKTVQYLLSDAAITDFTNVSWNTYNGAFSINPDSKVVIYAKVTDNDGNSIIVNSNGIVLDKTAPVLSSITDGETYYGNKTFAVNDALAGVNAVTVDGTAVTLNNGEHTIVADNAQHTIVVTDNAGNATTYTVTVYKIYTVTYKADGQVVSSQSVNHGADATAPAIPTKDGYTQTAPYWDKDGKNITTDTEINAVYTINEYTVTYKADGVVVDTQTVEHGKNAAAPAIPTKIGYTQTAPTWDKDGKNITTDTEINAVYTINEYTVTYKADGVVVDTQTVEHGKNATAPAIPTKVGYTQTAPTWDKDGKNITTDTEINAEYTINKYTVTFNTNGGGDIEAITGVAHGSEITKPTDPTKDKANFAGWFTDSACTKAWNFSNDTVTTELTLYAKWSDVPVYHISGKVLEKTGDGESDIRAVPGANVQLMLGTKVVAEQISEADGMFYFGGQIEGDYNVVVTYGEGDLQKIVTVLAEVHGSDVDGITVTLPKDVTNSIVEHDPAADGKDSIAAGTLVGGLEDVAAAVRGENQSAQKVEVKLTVADQPPVTGTPSSGSADEKVQKQQKAIQQKAGGKQMVFFDLSVMKTINNGTSEAITDTGDNLLEVRIPFDSGNKWGITIYRYHGDKAEALAAVNEGSTTEGFWVGDDGYIHIYTKKFSTYAIGYTVPSYGYYVPVISDTVTSANTFDAGIVVYVTMSVLAATGSAVVIGKKRKEEN